MLNVKCTLVLQMLTGWTKTFKITKKWGKKYASVLSVTP